MQIIDELVLCGRSETVPAETLRREYVALRAQLSLEDAGLVGPARSNGLPTAIRFLGRDLACFHRPSVLSMFREIFLYQHYNLVTPIPSDATIIDAGANIGLFSIYMRLLYPKCDLHLFEADPVTTDALRRNVANYLGTKCTVYAGALGYKDGEVELFEDAGNPNRTENTTLETMTVSGTGPTRPGIVRRVPQRRLSRIIEALPKVDYLKIDIEGSEFAVLMDLLEAGSLRKVANMSFEVHRRAFGSRPDTGSVPYTLATLFGVLEDAGFQSDIFAQAKRPFRAGQVGETFMLRVYR